LVWFVSGMEADIQGSSVAEWSESSGILREDLGTVEVDPESETTGAAS
jgi:hypothetical protein